MRASNYQLGKNAGSETMKREIDFIAEHKEKMRMLEETADTPPSKRDWQRFELSKELVEAQQPQFKRIKNEKKWAQLENVFFPQLCKIAKIQGGRVELDINEETFFAELVYIGDDLTLNNIFCTDLSDFSAIVSAAEDIYISVKGEYFKFQFLFNLYDTIKVADHAKEIAEVQRKIQRHRLENMLLHRISEDNEDHMGK